MAYSRQFPQNITPKGTSVQAGFENDDKEIKRILDILSNTGALSLAGSKRQSVLYGPTDSNGSPNFLTATGLSISIDGSSKPIIFAFANGFSPSSGSIDLIDKVDSLINSAWTLPPNQTYYLYVDKDKTTGLLSFGYTILPDLYLNTAPASPVLDLHYFNTNEMKMYCYNGSAWDIKQRIFVASVVTVASTATISIYPLASKVPQNIVVSGISDRYRQNGKNYSIGDIAYSAALPSWARLECVFAGKTAPVEPTWGSTAGVYVADGAVKWIIDDCRDSIPCGRILHDLILRTGYVKLNGATVNRADYPRLLKLAVDNSLFYNDGKKVFTGTTAVSSTTISGISITDIAKLTVGMLVSGAGISVGTTITAISTTSITISVAATAAGTVSISFGNATNFPGLFGVGDGSTTFVLPNIYGLFIEGGESGKSIIAGLPDVAGTFSTTMWGKLSGAFTLGAYTSGVGNNLQQAAIVNFSASKSNNIYGSSTTVQPPTVTMIPQIKY